MEIKPKFKGHLKIALEREEWYCSWKSWKLTHNGRLSKEENGLHESARVDT